jgi:4-methylaminobutanoate oxidase (formaldehyde-forming)
MTENIAVESLPSRAKTVIIGGGIIGCSVAYHLTKLGWHDIVLLEKSSLTAGTTWHAAGLVETGGFDSWPFVEMATYSIDLYKRLEAETGQSTGFTGVGYLEFATHEDNLIALRRTMEFSQSQGIMTEEISAEQVKALWPMIYADDILAGFFTPDDGRVNPIDTAMALAKGAKTGGVEIFEGVEVTGISQKNGQVTGVQTDRGPIAADYVVNCAGMWAREIGKLAGVNVPLQAAEHYYLLTEPIEGIHAGLPVMTDVERHAYYREEGGGLLVGLFEPVAAPWALDGIPKDFAFGEIQPDWDRMSPYLEEAMKRIPALAHAGIHKLFCGPESFTPDLSPLLGEAPELQNFYVGAGFNSLGILLGGGAGRVLAQWIVDGIPDVDVSELDIARMMPHQNSAAYLKERTVEMLGHMIAPGFPAEPYETARNVKRSPYHDRLAAAGAHFGTYGDWETPFWFVPPGEDPEVNYSWGRANYFEYVAAEHRATREGVTLTDYSVMAKILVKGRGAEKLLNRVSTNNISVPVGRCVYTQWLNKAGGIIGDLTVTRVAEDEYLVLTGDATTVVITTWLRRHAPPEDDILIMNITSASSALTLQGPRSRELLEKVTSADMSNAGFPYLTLQEIEIGYATAQALRITYVGELGYELYIPSEFSLHVFERLAAAGEDVNMRFSGIESIDTLRLEKGYRDIGNDFGNQDTPLELGLKFLVDFDKPGGFIGKQALEARIQAGPPKYRLVQFLLDDPEPLLFANEPIYRDGVLVGNVSAAGYGHSLGAAVAAGTVAHEDGVTPSFVKSGSYEILAAGKRHTAQASLRPLYDPKNEKIKL